MVVERVQDPKAPGAGLKLIAHEIYGPTLV
jgi:hypothetical protein